MKRSLQRLLKNEEQNHSLQVPHPGARILDETEESVPIDLVDFFDFSQEIDDFDFDPDSTDSWISV